MKEEIISWVKTIIISLVIGLILTTFALPTVIHGTSMAPTLWDKDLLLVNRLSYKSQDPSCGDIIVFKVEAADKNLIKRVIGVAGDLVEIKNGVVFVNGQELEEVYVDKEDKTSRDLTVVVPEGKFFVLGDNRNNSNDSRNSVIGLVDKDIIIGKAYFRLFPLSKIGRVK